MAQASLHILHKHTSISSLYMDTNSQAHRMTVILLKTATLHTAPPDSYSTSPGNAFSTSGD